MTGYTGKEMNRFWSKVNKTDDCWIWLGSRAKSGYGQISIRGKSMYAHRVSLEMNSFESNDEGLHVDHLCFNKICVNPSHLELVTPGENARRYFRKNYQRESHCGNGHPFTAENTRNQKTASGVRRMCRICCRANDQKYRDKFRVSTKGLLRRLAALIP